MSLKIQEPQPLADDKSEASVHKNGQSTASMFLKGRTNGILVFLALGFFWFRLIDNLRLTWSTDPQYGYGWLVPLLCVGLLARRWSAIQEPITQKTAIQNVGLAIISFLCLAFLFLPTRLIESAVPEWRPIEWLLGIETIGLTLCAIYLAKGRHWLMQLSFPILFFFVAIPWPTLFETPIIQALTRVSAVIVVQLLGWFGVPALTHGNVIQVATGMVGIDDACSGIRSFQSSIMISLFLGELYRLNLRRRTLLVLLSFLFSMGFNICRMSILTMIAARDGVAAISRYHDPAGISIAIACTLVLWGLAVFMKRESRRTEKHRRSDPVLESTGHKMNAKRSARASATGLQRGETTYQGQVVGRKETLNLLAAGLIVWLAVVEIGVRLWYHHVESRLIPGPNWTVDFPTNNPTFKILPIDDATRNLLRFDNGEQASWVDSDGSQWEVFYFNWQPGRVAGYLAKRHTPEICLPATGLKMLKGPKLTMMNVNGVDLPMRSYLFQSQEGLLHVYHCIWEAGVKPDAYAAHASSRFNLIRGVWAGRGNKGQKVLEIIIFGINNPEQLKAALERELDRLIDVEKSPSPQKR